MTTYVNETMGIDPTEEELLREKVTAAYGALSFDEDDFQEALSRKAKGLTKDVVADYPFVQMVATL